MLFKSKKYIYSSKSIFGLQAEVINARIKAAEELSLRNVEVQILKMMVLILAF